MQNTPCSSPKKFCDQDPEWSSTSEIELEICRFYEKALKEIFKSSKVSFAEIRKSLRNIRSYKNVEVDEHDIISYDENADRLAYIFAYSVLHTVVVHDRFQSMLKGNPTMSEKIVSMSDIRLCILGGGPAFEAAAVCKIFNSLREMNGSVKQQQPLQMYVTVVDVFKGWKDDAKMIVTSAQENLCSSDNVEIHFNFLEADMTSEISKDVKAALKKAHIVTMCKFLSAANEASYLESEITGMVPKIVDCMSFKACIFFLDTSGGGHFKKVDKLIDDLHETSRIYGPCLYNCHILSIDSVQEFCKAVGNIFRYLKCTARTTISCSAWLKIRHIIKIDEIVYDTAKTSIGDPAEIHKIKGRKVKVKKVFQSTAKLIEEL